MAARFRVQAANRAAGDQEAMYCSSTDSGSWPVNWNRSFVLPTGEPAAGVLHLHGLSDSPYSMRALGEGLH